MRCTFFFLSIGLMACSATTFKGEPNDAGGTDGATATDGGGAADGDAATPGDAGTFSCGTKTCARGGDYCRIASGSTSCVPLPQGCTSCACLPKGGVNCSCTADGDGNLTETCL